MTDALGYQIQALDALGPTNSTPGGRHSIVGRPTAVIAAALWLSLKFALHRRTRRVLL